MTGATVRTAGKAAEQAAEPNAPPLVALHPGRNRSFLERLDQAAVWIEQLAERRRVLLLVGFTLVYTLITGAIASRKLLWNDELFTYHLARLDGRDLWAALATGAEQIPPTFHLLSRACGALPGTDLITLRLPEMIGFWVLCLCLFQFIARRCGALCGFVALLFPLVTYTYQYAYEARPYGAVLGFTGLALVGWQAAAGDESGGAAAGRRRGAAALLLALSLAGAVCLHYYALFIAFPLALAEAARTHTRRRMNLPVWAALGAGTVAPLLLFLPLIRQSRSYAAAFWSPPEWTQIPNFYGALLMLAAPALAGALMIAALYAAEPEAAAAASAPPAPQQRRVAGSLTAEIIAGAGFVVLPIGMIVVGQLVTHAFTYRYALPAVAGVSILIALGAGHVLPSRRAVVPATLAVLLVITFASMSRLIYSGVKINDAWPQIETTQSVARTERFLTANAPGALPIVVADIHMHALLSQYLPPAQAARVTYLADPEASLRILGQSSLDQGMLALVGPFFGYRVDAYQAFQANNPRFFVYGTTDNRFNWLFSDLAHAGRSVQMQGRNGDYLLFFVDSTQKGTLSATASAAAQAAPASHQHKAPQLRPAF